MREFKVGDRVRVVSNSCTDYFDITPPGSIGTIVRLANYTTDRIHVSFKPKDQLGRNRVNFVYYYLFTNQDLQIINHDNENKSHLPDFL